MSKRDILTVCALAAHLAQNQRTYDTGIGEFMEYVAKPEQCAADAMALQRLGRRARNNETKRCNIQGYDVGQSGGIHVRPSKYTQETARIVDAVKEVLQPYGLAAQVGGDPRGCCLHILGLPGNTGGDESGFGI